MGDSEAGPSGRGKWARQEGACIDSMPPDVLERILGLGWLPPTPLYDRGDVLHDAAALACVGNATCTELAHRLFAELSPRRGQELPGGVTAASPAKALKDACKEWGLPTGGTKGALWERLLNEVQDSEEGEDGQALRRCLVSGATREELTGWSQKRISLKKARETFNLYKSEIEACDFILDPHGPGAKPGMPVKAFLLSDLKAKARLRYGSWECLTGKRAQEKQNSEEWFAKYRAELQHRTDALQGELLKRGHTVALASCPSWLKPAADLGLACGGSGKGEAPDKAVDYLERLYFCVSSFEREETYGLRFVTCNYQAPRKLAQYKACSRTRCGAMLACKRSICVPVSMLCTEQIREHKQRLAADAALHE
ncbi:hypothetical protein ABPG77_005028 [Micractinium sp. CCAP 211/92]